MATKSKNLELTLPSGSDRFDINVLNQNWSKLDEVLSGAGGGHCPHCSTN